MPRKTVKKPTNWRLKSITLAKLLVRKQGYCDWCGAKHYEAQMHGAHIMPEEYSPTAADPFNILCLCASCHKFKKAAWHKSPMEAAEWFNTRYPGRYGSLKARAHAPVLMDWESTYKKLATMA